MPRSWFYFELLIGIFFIGVRSDTDQSQIFSEPFISITPPISYPFTTTPATSSYPSTFAPPTHDPFITTTTTTTSYPSTFAPPTHDPFITTATTTTSYPSTFAPPTHNPFITTTTTPTTSYPSTFAPPTHDPFITTTTTTYPSTFPPSTHDPFSTIPTITYPSTLAPPTHDPFTNTPATSDSSFIETLSTSVPFTNTPPASYPFTNTLSGHNSVSTAPTSFNPVNALTTIFPKSSALTTLNAQTTNPTSIYPTFSAPITMPPIPNTSANSRLTSVAPTTTATTTSSIYPTYSGFRSTLLTSSSPGHPTTLTTNSTHIASVTSSPTAIATSTSTVTTISSPVTSATSNKFSSIQGSASPLVVVSDPAHTDQLVVTWNPPPGHVDFYVVDLGSVSKRVNANVTTVTFTALSPGTEYRVVVQAISGNTSSTIAVVTEATYPSPPGSVTRQSIGTSTVSLDWEEPANMSDVEKSFLITVTGNRLFRFDTRVYNSNTSAVTVTDLTPGGYTFTIVTVGARRYTSTPITQTVQLPDVGAIVGAVVGSIGGVLVLIILGVVIWTIVRRRNSSWGIRKVTQNTVQIDDFETMFHIKEKSGDGFTKEFAGLQCAGALQSRSAAIHPANAAKNHPQAVYPYDKYLVKLSNSANSSNGYINASYIPGQRSKKEFIVAQSPLQETLSDFWQLVWEHHVTAVVMLTGGEDNGPAQESEEYWPSRESRLFGKVLVTFVEEKPAGDWTVREFTLTHVRKNSGFRVTQFQHSSWPPAAGFRERKPLIQFVTRVLQHRKEPSIQYPTLVHCRIGGSRCGIFVALSRIISQLEERKSVAVYDIAHELLLHRPSMIQTEEEYIFLHRCALDVIRAKDQDKGNSNYDDSERNDDVQSYSDEQEYERVLRRYPSRCQEYAAIYDTI